MKNNFNKIGIETFSIGLKMIVSYMYCVAVKLRLLIAKHRHRHQNRYMENVCVGCVMCVLANATIQIVPF